MADNTIANAIKFLKGEEKSLPAAKTEGQVYFAYKNVGTAEKPSYTGAIYIDTPIGGTQNRIKMTANADIADKAFNDSAGLNIRDTYLSGLGYTDDGKQTILIKGSGNNQTRIALPIASTAKSGIVTTDAQSFGGTKTFATINSTNLTVIGSSGFSYTGIETATGDKARPVWFAYDGINGKPVVNTNFTYNPATQTLSVANLSGTADKANKDSAGNDIRNTYISNITVNNDIMTITKGSGATSTLSIKDKLYSGAMIATKEDLDKFIETNVFKFGHINAIEGYNGLEKNSGIILSASWKSSTDYAHQIFIDDNGYDLRHRYKDNGIWSDWTSILDSANYNSYAPTKAGGGAYGTWDINILGNAASANKLNTNAGSATFPVYFSNGVPVACSTNLAVNITGNAASATKLTSNAGSTTQPIYFKDGKPVATTYSLNATVKAGTSNRVAFYSGNNEISSASSLKYYTATNSKKANQTILRIWGNTYGNDATTMISGKASSLSWNDGGPQIQFSTSEAGSQDGALIFTDHDSAGVGASFHFVSNQSEWSVVSKRFVAKTSVIIGQENHTANNQGYNLYVNGTEYINGILTAVGDCAFITKNNEFNFVPTLKASTNIWFNYRQTGGQPTNNNFIINEYVFGNGANKALASIKDGLFSGAATYVRDSNNNTNNISITYSKAAQASTSWLASWNGYELGSISPSNITAGKATMLATARKISLTGDAVGSATFNGGADISISTVTRQTCFVGSDSASSSGWYKVASQTMSGYVNSNIMFAVTSTYSNYYTGIFSLQIRSDNTSIQCPKAEWLVRSGFSADSIKIVISGMTWTMYVNRSVSQYGRIMFEVLTQSSTNGKSSGLTMYNTYTKESVTPNATKTSSDGGTVNYANSANSAIKLNSSAGSSTQPIYFSGGKPVACTYTLNKSVPADAKFTDTNTWRGIQDNLTSTSTSDSLSANQGRILKGLIDGKAASNHGHNIIGLPRVTKDANTTAQRNIFKVEEFSNGTNYNLPSNAWYHIFTSQGSDTNYATQLALGMTTTDIAYRIRNGSATAWNGWNTIIHSGNYTSYTVTKIGTGASGTWGINVSGNAATAAKLQTARTISLTGSVTGSGTFDGSGNLSITTSTNHSHSQYLPLAGGTMNGTSFIIWADSGNWNNNNNNVTFPVTRGGLRWYGQSDCVELFSQETASNNLELVLQFKDDNSNGLSIRNSTGTQTARIAANGNIAADSLRVGNGSGSTINFCTNGSTANPGAKIVAYNDRIEFVFA